MGNIERVREIAEKLSKFEIEYGKLLWVQYTTSYDFGLEEAHRALTEVYKDKENYNVICEHLDMELDDEDRRRVDLVYNAIKPYHLSDELNELEEKIQKKTNELSKILNTHRVHFEGREVSSVELTQILYNDEDRERRKSAYLARCQVNKPLVEGGFIELLNLRKEYARKSGSKDFVEYKLKEAELSPSIFDTWVSELHGMLPKIKETRRKYAQIFLKDDKIMPWDEFYINSRIAPSLNTRIDMSDYHNNIRELFNLFGIDISKYNITYDVFSRSNKSEWGYNFTIETGRDSRILANVKNQLHEYGVLLHETGHAVHSFNLDPEEVMLNMGVSGIISEGIANLFGGFLYDRAFFTRFFKNNLDGVEEEFKNIREYKKLNSLLSIHGILFDQALYRNDIDSLEDIYNVYWKTYREILQEEPFGDEVPWGYVIHHTTHPIYRHNYFMGDVTCEMLSKVFCSKYGVEDIMDKPKEFGEFLINEVIKSSGLYKFEDLFRRISGENFSLKYMID